MIRLKGFTRILLPLPTREDEDKERIAATLISLLSEHLQQHAARDDSQGALDPQYLDLSWNQFRLVAVPVIALHDGALLGALHEDIVPLSLCVS